ncbi:sensor domain-containing protein [Chloroflexota bacterium]
MSVSKKRGFFGVVAEPQSYLNIVYLLLALPLGTFCFVFLVTGLSLGFGLIITLVGIPILLLVISGSWVLCRFERQVAITLLNEDIPLSVSLPTSGGLWSRVKVLLKDRVTWTGVIYLFVKFPLGIVTFTIAVTLIAVTLGFLAAPTYAWTSDSIVWGSWSFDPFYWSWIPTIIGIPMVFISLHLMNAITVVFGRMTRAMLENLQ